MIIRRNNHDVPHRTHTHPHHHKNKEQTPEDRAIPVYNFPIFYIILATIIISLFIFMLIYYSNRNYWDRKISKFLQICWKIICRIYRLLKSIICRLLYTIHALFTLWRVTEVVDNNLVILFIFMCFSAIPIEAYHAFKHRMGKEYKWWSPVTCAYLMAVVPCFLLLEIHNHESAGGLVVSEKEYFEGFEVEENIFEHFFRSNLDRKMLRVDSIKKG